MKTRHLCSIAFLGSLLLNDPSFAQARTADPVGFITIPLLADSDTHVSIPFTRPPEFVGAVQSISGNNIIVPGSPWTANQFVYSPGLQPKSYYALIGSGPSNSKEGRTYYVTGNTANSLIVDTTQGDLSGILPDTEIILIPYWTPATIFPPSAANISFTPTISSGAYKTQLRIPNYSAGGINPGYAASYFYSDHVDGSSNVGWRQVGDNNTDRGDDPLLPEGHFVVRNMNGAPTLPMVAPGAVLLKKLTVPLVTTTSQAEDNAVSIVRPVDVPLNASGLNAADASFVPGSPGDQLLLFNNAQPGFDKVPSAIYTYSPLAGASGGWRLTGDTTGSDRGPDVISAGQAAVIRKAPTATGGAAVWTNSFPVLAISAVSRKTHGASGNFDIHLPLTGMSGVECRAGSDLTIVFTFPKPVTFSGAAVTSGSGAVASTSNGSGTEVAVNLSGVADGQRLTVTLLAVNDGANINDVAVHFGLLVGDTTGNGTVNASDIGQAKAHSGEATTAANFRLDVTTSGSVNASDISVVKTKSGTALP